MKTESKWELTWTVPETNNKGRIESDDYTWLEQRAIGLKQNGCKDVAITSLPKPQGFAYEPNTLPPGWKWEGVVAGPDGFNGRIYICNVASDINNGLWVFTKYGRYRMHRSEFERRLIGVSRLPGLPLHIEPSDSP